LDVALQDRVAVAEGEVVIFNSETEVGDWVVAIFSSVEDVLLDGGIVELGIDL